MDIKYAGKKINLLRCPFCDGEPTVYLNKWGRRTFKIACDNENCIMVETLFRPSLEQAAREWNHRPWNRVPEMKEEIGNG